VLLSASAAVRSPGGCFGRWEPKRGSSLPRWWRRRGARRSHFEQVLRRGKRWRLVWARLCHLPLEEAAGTPQRLVEV